VPLAAGHYESFYLKASSPAQPLGIWIRYTVHKRPGERAKGSLWFTLFDHGAGGPLASKVTLPAEDLAAGGGDYIRLRDSRFGEGVVEGAAPSRELRAQWSLRFASDEPPLRHLPREWMYRAPLPRTKLLSPWPAARFDGTVEANGRRIELDGWPGMVGHNWGAQHAERWIWLHGSSFEERGPGTWIDAGFGRVRLGPWTTPWIANGALTLEGERHPLGGIGRTRATRVSERRDGCEVTLPGPALTLRAVVRTERSDFVGWVYADPDGSEHQVVNCSIASMSVEVRRSNAPAAPPIELRTEWGAAYELGMRERDHGVPIQPFPDG
jgi:hypothetical protein